MTNLQNAREAALRFTSINPATLQFNLHNITEKAELQGRDLASPRETLNCIQAPNGALWASFSSSYHTVFAK